MSVIYLAMYVFVYPLYALLSLLAFGPFGVISAFFIILQYSNLILGFLILVFITPGARGVVFDAVLTRDGQHELVVQYEQQRHVDPMTKCQKVSQFICEKLPMILLFEIMLLFLGMIPVIGPCIVLLLRAPCKGRSLLSRYFKLKGWDKRRAKEFDTSHRGDYTALGATSMLFEMIPFLTLLTLFTDTIGGALWTVDLEFSGNMFSVQVDTVDTAETGSNAALVTGTELGSQQESGVLI